MALARDIIRQSVRRQELMSRGEDAARSGSPSGETRKSWAREEVWAEVLDTQRFPRGRDHREDGPHLLGCHGER